MPKCKKCGNKVDDTDNFCTECGAKLNETCALCWVKNEPFNCGHAECPGYMVLTE